MRPSVTTTRPKRHPVVGAATAGVAVAACCAWIAAHRTRRATRLSRQPIDDGRARPDRRTGGTRHVDDRRIPTAWLRSRLRRHGHTHRGGARVVDHGRDPPARHRQRCAALRRLADLAAFGNDAGDGVGINLIAQALRIRTRKRSSTSTRPEGVCQSTGVQPYDDGVVSGLAWLATECGPQRQGVYLLVVASPPDQSVTYRLQAGRTATPADEPGIDMVLETFGPVPTGTVHAATLPPSIVPAGSEPTVVTHAFLGRALAHGDGAGACSLLNPDDIGNFSGGIRNCAADLSAQIAGQGPGWASIGIVADSSTSSASCGDEDPDDEFVSLELQGPNDDGCLSIGLADGTWLIETALSNSIWSQASAG